MMDINTVENINATYNQVLYVADAYDEWKTPGEFMEDGGDCEDYAIAKYFDLRRRGVPTSELWLAIGNEPGGVKHAVLIYKRQWVLDNNYSYLRSVSDYRFDMFFNERETVYNGKRGSPDSIRQWDRLMRRMEGVNE